MREAITSDVLVIGGGGAALVAALSAAEAGAEVAMVSKGPPGLLSCTAYAGGGFTAAVGGFEPDRHRDLTMETGRGINDFGLVSTVASEGPAALDWLRERGVALDYRRGGAAMAGRDLGKLVKGTAMTMPLLRRCEELGVEIHHPIRITGLLGDEFGGPIGGALGEDKSGDKRVFRAAATVLATGGGAWTFSHTDNPRGLTGDGYLLGFSAGCSLRDMEFVQFYPLGPGPEVSRTWYMDARILDRVRLTDGEGRDFLTPLLEEWGLSSGREINMLARDRLSRAIAQKRRETGHVVLHLEDLPESDRRDPRLEHRARLMSGPGTRDPWRPVEVSPVSHFMCGGIVVDERGRTEVPGLLACGEVTGGVHGANRVGGNALTELTVFGIRAGKSAADAAGYGATAINAENVLTAESLDLSRWTTRRAVVSEPYRRFAYEKIGPYRTTDSMEEFIAAVGRRLRREAFGASTHEERSLHWTGAAVALAAHARKESRGTHFTEDYPAESEDMARPIRLIPRYRDGIIAPEIEFLK